MLKIIPLFVLITLLSCGKSQTTQPPLLDIRAIAAHAEVETHPHLGKPTDTKSVKINGKNYPKCSYKDGAVEIVYINGKADWITITLKNGTFDKTALGIIGLPIADPTFSSQNVLRWENYEGIRDLSLFSKPDGTIDYFYIKTLTP